MNLLGVDASIKDPELIKYIFGRPIPKLYSDSIVEGGVKYDLFFY